MKRSVKLLILISAMALFSATAYGKTVNLQVNSDQIYIDGNALTIDQPPVIADSRTLVPVRAVSEAFEGEVSWDATSKTATVVSLEGDEIKLTIGSKTAYLNGKAVELDVAPAIINERTMLPIRFIAESFGFDTRWIEESKSIIVQKEDSGEGIGIGDDDISYTDAEGNVYIEHVNEDMSLEALRITDKSGKTKAMYKFSGAYEDMYISKDGKKLTFTYNSKDDTYTVTKDGTEKSLKYVDFVLTDDEGNTYDVNNGIGGLFTVKDKNGKVTETYTFTEETHNIFETEKGEKVCVAIKYEGGYKDGFVDENGKFTAFDNDHELAMMGSDNRIYSLKHNYLLISDDQYNLKEVLKETGGNLFYIAGDGEEYPIDGTFAEGYTIVRGDKTIVLTCDFEEEHNKELFARDSYGTEDEVYYKGDDGNTYVGKDNNFKVYDGQGNEIDTYTACCQEINYEDEKGGKATICYSYLGESDCVKIGDKRIELNAIMG
ncbi:MAG: copper amine oxidase N-terminal domain-containing protein [Firmicutes bacterium]|nr:copper amine oxidase N-terminal domain-containing protein [Bacillota bacterium]